jgi:hypothetical protein
VRVHTLLRFSSADIDHLILKGDRRLRLVVLGLHSKINPLNQILYSI